jgi:hypothetical protein
MSAWGSPRFPAICPGSGLSPARPIQTYWTLCRREIDTGIACHCFERPTVILSATQPPITQIIRISPVPSSAVLASRLVLLDRLAGRNGPATDSMAGPFFRYAAQVGRSAVPESIRTRVTANTPGWGEAGSQSVRPMHQPCCRVCAQARCIEGWPTRSSSTAQLAQ